MTSEIVSTARPTPLRLWGFVCTAVGALLAGLGATRDWAVVGFKGDSAGSANVVWRGTDTWEGKVVLASAVLALILTITLRLATGNRTRLALAVVVLSLGALVMALSLSVVMRPDVRFGGEQSLDVTQVDLELGVWLVLGGGLLIAIGGALSLAWARGGSGGPELRAGARDTEGSSAGGGAPVDGGSEASGASRRSEAPPGGPAPPSDPG